MTAGLRARSVTIQSEKKANIWLAPTSDLDHPRQLTTTSYDGLNGLAWTPDGKLVYTSQIAGEQNLWITDPNGGRPSNLPHHAGFSEQPTVSLTGVTSYFFRIEMIRNTFGELISTASTRCN